ncbi:MAG: hypothetical protein ABI759_01905 [Candidatus Solibacter sp.]
MAALASFRLTSPSTLSEMARRTGTPPSAASRVPENQGQAPNIAVKTWRRETVELRTSSNDALMECAWGIP